MSQSDILIQYANMEAAAQALKTQAGVMQTLVENLGTSLQPLFNTWGMTGSKAAEAMQQDETNLKNTINDIINLVTQFSTAVDNAQQLQASIDATNASMFSGS